MKSFNIVQGWNDELCICVLISFRDSYSIEQLPEFCQRWDQLLSGLIWVLYTSCIVFNQTFLWNLSLSFFLQHFDINRYHD